MSFETFLQVFEKARKQTKAGIFETRIILYTQPIHGDRLLRG